MPISLSDWNEGMDDAEAGRLTRPGMTPDYYNGYDFACAVNYEYMGCTGVVAPPFQRVVAGAVTASLAALSQAVSAHDVSPEVTPETPTESLVPVHPDD